MGLYYEKDSFLDFGLDLPDYTININLSRVWTLNSKFWDLDSKLGAAEYGTQMAYFSQMATTRLRRFFGDFLSLA